VTPPPAALYPAFLKLAGRKVLVVGGGTVAASKLPALIEAQAAVTVVAPAIAAACEFDGVTLVRREFVPGDLDGVWFVVAAAMPDVNREVAAAAAARRLFVNAVDDPENASAYLGGAVRRAGVTIAISTDGAAPAMAGLLREGVDALLPQDLEAWTREAQRIRTEWRAARVPMGERRPLLLEALNRLYEKR
jgi:uroporphyrin-III C-methyltransferase/precorrin-2 dehydrogenase/sirohydrochlorin ferrochelatase